MTPHFGVVNFRPLGLPPSRSSDATSMEPPRDFCELLECFNANHVSVVVVDAYALGFHGAPRMTGDLDLLVQPSAENAKRIIDALAAFGFGDM